MEKEFGRNVLSPIFVTNVYKILYKLISAIPHLYDLLQ